MISLDAGAGLLVGLMIGLTGVGGGALMTPLLLLVFGTAPQTAVGTDLLYAALTKMAGAWLHTRQGSVDGLVLRRLLTGSVPAACATMLVMMKIGNSEYAACTLSGLLGVTLIVTGIALAFRQRVCNSYAGTTAAARLRPLQAALTMIAGGLIGCLVTLTSVGAGALGAVALTYLYPRRLTPTKLIGTDLAHAIPLTLIAGLGHASIGNVDFVLLGHLLAGSLPGIVIGTWLGRRLRAEHLRAVLAIALLLTGCKFVWSFANF